MSKVITIKLVKAGAKPGPFTLTSEWGNTIATGVTISQVTTGVSFTVDDNVNLVTIKSEGKCNYQKTFPVGTITEEQYINTKVEYVQTGCAWRHTDNHTIYNTYYGNIEPYIIEYPFAYQYQDEILQNVKDYTKVYKYFTDPYGVTNDVSKIELDDVWFNKAVLYNGQQSSGMLFLTPKPKNSLKSYMQYPIFHNNGKTITFTKSDNFYLINNFWTLNKSSQVPLFLRSCESLSIDKVINQSNMDYSSRSFKKAPLRAKDLKCRFILDNRSDIHLVSQYVITPSQISYK